tara:strand:- start:132 stop:335 length:204 start_codon:yes stop_codon:yes gene_type:complete
MTYYEVRVLKSQFDYYRVHAKDAEEAKELIKETVYGRGKYGKKDDTIKREHEIQYAVQLSPEGEVII